MTLGKRNHLLSPHCSKEHDRQLGTEPFSKFSCLSPAFLLIDFLSLRFKYSFFHLLLLLVVVVSLVCCLFIYIFSGIMAGRHLPVLPDTCQVLAFEPGSKWGFLSYICLFLSHSQTELCTSLTDAFLETPNPSIQMSAIQILKTPNCK